MNTRFYMILETLPISFKMVNDILKKYTGVHMELQGFSGSFTKKNKNNAK